MPTATAPAPSSAPWVVMKFGGTSVSTAPNWANIARLVRSRLDEGLRPLVVHSALAGVSNQLEAIALRPHALDVNATVVAIETAHRALARDLALDADALLAAATDVRGQPKWSSHDVVASVKLTSGASSFDYYQVLDNPSPVADRYWFVHGTSGVVGNDRVFTWDQLDAGTKYPQQVAEVLAKDPGAVSTTVNLGDWTFTPDGTETKVRYRICTDAGGNIPGWMGQIAARSTLPTNVADIVREVKRRTGG